MRCGCLFLLGLLVLVNILSAALEHYPRPWEDKVWIEENEHLYSFFGIGVIYSEEVFSEEQKFLAQVLFNVTHPSLQESLDAQGALQKAGEREAQWPSTPLPYQG